MMALITLGNHFRLPLKTQQHLPVGFGPGITGFAEPILAKAPTDFERRLSFFSAAILALFALLSFLDRRMDWFGELSPEELFLFSTKYS